MRRLIRAALVIAAFAAMTASTPAQAARPCNQYPTFIQPITCRVLERLP